MSSPMRRNFAAARLRREQALARTEIMQPTAPRVSSAGIMSMSIKTVPEGDRRLIDEALEKRARGIAFSADPR